MSPQVLLEIVRVRAGVITLFASKGLVTIMNHHVTFQVAMRPF